MPKDLRLKLASLVQDTERMNSADRTKALERFMNHEFEMIESPHHLSFDALLQIHSRATRIMRDLPMNLHLDGKRLHDHPELCRTICFVQATYEYFRAEKMTPYLLSFDSRNPNKV